MVNELKKCPQCGKEYPATPDFFYRHTRTKDGLNSCCKNCSKKKCKEYYWNNREKELKRSKKWDDEHKEHRKQYRKQYRKTNKKTIKESDRKYALKSKFGITFEEYNQMKQEQDYKCAICGCEETSLYKGKIRDLAVDHDHNTGEVRELLCNSCNNVIGFSRENPFILIQAINYIKKHK